MAGKRPDQYRIDPGEGGATDYKNLPQTGRGQSDLDDTVELDKQLHAREQQEARNQPFPGRRPAPGTDANRPLKAKQIEDQLDSEPGAADTSADKENPAA